MLLLPQLAQAANIDVNTSRDEWNSGTGTCSLREAIHAANINAAFGGCIAGSKSQADYIRLKQDVVLDLHSPVDIYSAVYIYSSWPKRYFVHGARSAFTIKNRGNATFDRVGFDTYTLTPIMVNHYDSTDYPLVRPVVYLNNVQISGNQVANLSNSAAIQVGQGSYATINGSIIQNNGGAIRGGGIINFGTTTITNSVFAKNQAAQTGGGILNLATMSLKNVMVTDNTQTSGNAGGGGGGIYNSGTMDVWHSTITSNSAAGNASGGVDNTGTFRVWMSIIADNLGSGDCFGSFTSQGYNLVDDTCTGFSAGGDRTGSSLGLTALPAIPFEWNATITRKASSSSGATVSQIPWATCNPASTPDASHFYDQIGVQRSTGNACDIGAAEYQ